MWLDILYWKFKKTIDLCLSFVYSVGVVKNKH
jgi:hypothetical protein